MLHLCRLVCTVLINNLNPSLCLSVGKAEMIPRTHHQMTHKVHLSRCFLNCWLFSSKSQSRKSIRFDKDQIRLEVRTWCCANTLVLLICQICVRLCWAVVQCRSDVFHVWSWQSGSSVIQCGQGHRRSESCAWLIVPWRGRSSRLRDIDKQLIRRRTGQLARLLRQWRLYLWWCPLWLRPSLRKHGGCLFLVVVWALWSVPAAASCPCVMETGGRGWGYIRM